MYSTNFRLKDSTAHIILKNTTNNPITARPRFLPATGEGSGVVELAALTISPNAVKEVNLTALTNAAKTRTDLDSVGVQIISSGAASSLIGAANFTNNITGVDYDIPLRDSGTAQNSAGGYPVRLDDDYTTNLSITNVGDKAGKFTLQINYDGGVYAMYPHELAPGATATFDLRKIRDNQTPDSSGRLLPRNLTVGQIRWSMVGRMQTILIGRSEIISKSGKVSSSYSCGVSCPNSYHSSRLTPDEVFAELDDEIQFAAKESDNDGYGNTFYEYTVNDATWISNAPSIVEISGGGAATALDVGYVQLAGSWEAEYFVDNGSDGCMPLPVIVTPVAYMTVRPKITSISPNRAGVGSTTRVTIDGSGFTFSPTFNAGSGITVTVRTVNSTGTQATADLAIAADASGGNRSVSATVRGQTSVNNANFFVQIPASLSIVSITVLPTGSDESSSGCRVPQRGDYGIELAIRYQVKDQSGNSITNDQMVGQEKVTNAVYNNGSIPDPAPNFQDITPSRIVTTRSITDANGQFLDVPYGACGPEPFVYTSKKLF